MATLSTWEAGLIGRSPRQATQLAGAAYAVRAQLDRGIAFAPAQAAVAGELRHYGDLNRWREYDAFVALTGP